ncbi:IS4 family transposase, partial [Myroides sp. LJL115]
DKFLEIKLTFFVLLYNFSKWHLLTEMGGTVRPKYPDTHKTKNFYLDHIPRRSTLSDTNENRSVEFYAQIYNKLLTRCGDDLSDSRIKETFGK